MSGFEIAGVVLGGLPLLISAIEYSGKVKKYGKSYWRFRDAYLKETAQISHCQTIFQLHLQELLQPLLVVEVIDLVQYEDLLAKPGSNEWKEVSVEESLATRLAGTYDQYLTTLRALQEIIVRLSQKAKTQDTKFRQWLDDYLQKQPQARRDLVTRANAACAKLAGEPTRLRHIASMSSREELLAEAEAYIKRLSDHLASAERVTVASKESPTFARVPVPKALHGFWSTAHRIHSLMCRCFPCSCAGEHCARLWLDYKSLLSRSLDLQVLFDRVLRHAGSPWTGHDLTIGERKALRTCSCSAQAGSLNLKAFIPNVGAGGNPTISTQVPGCAANTPPLLGHESSLCNVLQKQCGSWQCLGSIHDDIDDRSFHVLQGSRSIIDDSISLADALDPKTNILFPLVTRLRVAMVVAIAHLRYCETGWLQQSWSPSKIYFPRNNASKVNFDLPCVFADFATALAIPAYPSGLDKLAIILLELAYGRSIELHAMWHDPQHPGRDPDDPLMRKAVACKWAEDLSLAIPGEGFAYAVQWCLHQAPRSSHAGSWRKEFADNVVAPLQAYK